MKKAPTRSAQIKRRELEEEVKQLRELLALNGKRDLEEWDLLPVQLRDQMAARAVMAEWGDLAKAIVRLGFPTGLTKTERIQLCDRLFNTPGVKKQLLQHTKEIEDNRDQLLARLQQIALHGSDDASVRAIQSLAKISGWQKSPDTVIDNRRITLVGLLGNDKGEVRESQQALPASVDAMDLLGHDPGEAIEVIDGELVG